jgi:hypothetical protein
VPSVNASRRTGGARRAVRRGWGLSVDSCLRDALRGASCVARLRLRPLLSAAVQPSLLMPPAAANGSRCGGSAESSITLVARSEWVGLA